jgi:hypothetical protein
MAQSRRGNPDERGASYGLWFVIPPAAFEEAEMDGFLRIIVGDALKKRSDIHLDSQFLTELPRETILESLAVLAFAARELPKSSEVSLGATLGNEQLAVAKDKRGGNIDDLHQSVSAQCSCK